MHRTPVDPSSSARLLPAASPAWRWIRWTSLDAVAVLVAYQWGLARSVGIPLPGALSLYLGGAVWLAYTADRIADVLHSPGLASRSGRHGFVRRHLAGWIGLWIAAVGVGAVWAPTLLPRPSLRAGWVLAGLAFAYVSWGSRIRSDAPLPLRHLKRGAAAALLALVGSWGIWSSPEGSIAAVLPVSGMFAGAAWWNLRLSGGEPASEVHRGAAMTLVGLALFLPVFGDPRLLPVAGVLAGGLAWVGRGGGGQAEDARPLLADLTLVLAFLLLGWMGGDGAQ